MAEMTSAAASREVTLMDLWLIVRSRRTMVLAVIVIAAVLGIALALLLPPQYRFTTAIEIGNQVVNEQIQPIEAPLTVISKLQNGYIPAITTQFVEADPNGPRQYDFEVIGSKDSQIVTIVSQGPKSLGAKNVDLHTRISTAVVQDHNRTADAMRDNAGIQLSEAEQKLGGLVADKTSLADQVASFDRAIIDMEKQAEDIRKRVAELDVQLGTLRGGANGDALRTTQSMLISQQIGQLKSVQMELDQKSKVELRIGRAKAQGKLENNAAEQETARNTIRFRQTNLKNIQATRSLGTITSIQPVAPNKPLVVVVAIVLGVIFGVVAALGLDFLARADRMRINA